MELIIIESLQIALYFFWVIVMILFSIVLFRIIKILWPIMEIILIYNKIKWILNIYSQIPDIIKNKAKDFIKK